MFMLNHLLYNLKTYKGGGTTCWCIRGDLDKDYNRSNRCRGSNRCKGNNKWKGSNVRMMLMRVRLVAAVSPKMSM
jgi:hypothetical protein